MCQLVSMRVVCCPFRYHQSLLCYKYDISYWDIEIIPSHMVNGIENLPFMLKIDTRHEFISSELTMNCTSLIVTSYILSVHSFLLYYFVWKLQCQEQICTIKFACQ